MMKTKSWMMRRNWAWVGGVFISLAWAIQTVAWGQTDENSPTTATLNVRVVWTGSDAVAPQAALSLSPQTARDDWTTPTAVTDAQGLATLTYPADLSQGRLGVNHPAAALQSIDLDLTTTKPVILILSPGATLSGRAGIEGQAEPIEGTPIYLLKNLKGLTDPILRQTQADAEGHYRFDQIAAGEYRIFAKAGKYRSSMEPMVTLEPGQIIDGHHIILLPGATLTGQIRDRITGRPLAGARVGFWSLLNKRLNTTLSDDEGTFLIEGLTDQPGELIASAPRKATQRVWIGSTLPSGPVDDIELEPGGSLQVRVLDEAKKPVEGVRISRKGPTWSGNVRLRVIDPGALFLTDPEGWVTIDGVALVEVTRLIVPHEGYQTETPSVLPGLRETLAL